MSFLQNILSGQQDLNSIYMNFFTIRDLENIRMVSRGTKSSTDEYCKLLFERNDTLRKVAADFAPKLLKDSGDKSFIRYLNPQQREELFFVYKKGVSKKGASKQAASKKTASKKAASKEAASKEAVAESKKIFLTLKSIYSVVKSATQVFQFNDHDLGIEETMQKYADIIDPLRAFEGHLIKLKLHEINRQLELLEFAHQECKDFGTVIDFIEEEFRMSNTDSIDSIHSIHNIQKMTALILLDVPLLKKICETEKGFHEAIAISAASHGYQEILEMMLAAGKLSKSHICHAIRAAAISRDQKILQVLLASEEISDSAANWPLYDAANRGDVEIVEVLLASKKTSTQGADEALQVAVATGQREVVEVLLASEKTSRDAAAAALRAAAY